MRYLSKIIEIGVYFFVFILPIQTRLILERSNIKNSSLEYNTISLYFSDIVLWGIFILLGIFLINRKRSNAGVFFIKSLFIISVLDLTILISIFFAGDKVLAVYKYIIFLSGIWFFYLFNNNYIKFNKIKFVYSFILGIVLQAILGFYQFVSQSAFSSKYFGIAEHNPIDLGVSVIQFINDAGIGERWLRAYGGLDHPNIFGGVMVIGLLVILGIFLSEKNKKDNFPFEEVILMFAYFLILAGLFFSFSRSAWLSFSFATTLILLWNIIEGWSVKSKKSIQFYSITFLFLGVLFFTYQDLAMTRIKGDTRLEDKSKNERVEYLINANEIIGDSFVAGVGIGNYSLEFEKLKKGEESWFYQPVHNVFILILAEIGIFGLLSYIGVLFSVFYVNFKKRNIINLSIFFSFVIMMMFDHWLWSLHFGVLFFWSSMMLIFNYEL